jgi:hypothetical protein
MTIDSRAKDVDHRICGELIDSFVDSFDGAR